MSRNGINPQLCPNGKYINYKPGQRKYYKRKFHKKWRKRAKKSPENAPKKMVFSGWVS